MARRIYPSAILGVTAFSALCAIMLSGCSIPFIPDFFPTPTPAQFVCSLPGGFTCDDNVLNVDGRFALFITQSSGSAITVTGVRCTQEANAEVNESDRLANPVAIEDGGSALITDGRQRCSKLEAGSPIAATGQPGDRYSGYIFIAYESADGSPHVAIGNISLSFESIAIPTPVPTPEFTPEPTATPQPATPTPTPEIPCPSSCLYGCEPGTAACRNPMCPVTCLNGCRPGTDLCLEVFENVSMNNTNFETGTYSAWTPFGNAFTLFIGQEFTPGGPKNIVLSNAQSSYYESPYENYEGTYVASSFPDRRATGGLVSQPFTINSNYLDFLVIGSEDKDLCVGLKIADTTPDAGCSALQRNPSSVRYFTSKGIIRPFSVFTRVAWNVEDLKGQQGVIEIIDSSTNAYIEVDDFKQGDSLQGTLVDNLVPSYYTCNHNTVCETGLGEYYQWCADDCPYPSSCRSTAEASGIVDYTLYCHAFKLTPQGLLLAIRNTGAGRGHAVTLTHVKCSQEESPDYSTYRPVNTQLNVNESIQVADGTMPCYDQDGVKSIVVPGETYTGRIFYRYFDTTTNYTWYGRLNFDVVVKNVTG